MAEKDLGGKVKDMCEVLDYVEARGEARGEVRGKEKNLLECIRRLMENLNMSAKQAMDALEVPETEQAEYMKKLGL